MKLFATIGCTGTLLPRIDEMAVAAWRYAGVSQVGQQHAVTFVRRERAFGAGAADAQAVEPGLRLMIDLPTSKQSRVPVCPRERHP